jgi:hypothetical protein
LFGVSAVPFLAGHLETGQSWATFLVLQGIGEYDFVPLFQPKEESK